MNNLKNLSRLKSWLRLHWIILGVLIPTVGLVTLLGCSDIYDVDRLPRYNHFGQKPGTAWLMNDQHGTWWCYTFGSSEPKLKRNARSFKYIHKTEREKLSDTRYLDSLVREINSMMPEWEWSWKLAHQSSYEILGKGPGSDWLSYDLKSRKEFLVEIYEKVVEATKVQTHVEICNDEGSRLGQMHGRLVRMLIKFSSRRATEETLNDQIRPLCKYLNEKHSKYSSMSPKWTWYVVLDNVRNKPVYLRCNVEKTPPMSVRSEFLTDATSKLATYGLDKKVDNVIVKREERRGEMDILAEWRSSPREDSLNDSSNQDVMSKEDLKKFKTAILSARFANRKLFSQVTCKAFGGFHFVNVEVTKHTFALCQSAPDKYLRILRNVVDKQHRKHVVSVVKKRMTNKDTGKGSYSKGMPLKSVFYIYYHEPSVGDLKLVRFEEKWIS